VSIDELISFSEYGFVNGIGILNLDWSTYPAVHLSAYRYDGGLLYDMYYPLIRSLESHNKTFSDIIEVKKVALKDVTEINSDKHRVNVEYRLYYKTNI